jgi:hypothetical protein
MFEIKKIKFGFTLINLLSQDATQGHWQLITLPTPSCSLSYH